MDENIAPATVGAIGELRVCADLLERGYEVFRALDQARHSCDLIALKGNLILRIEVRSGNGIYAPTGYVSYSKNRSSRTHNRRIWHIEPDHYAVLWKGELQRYDPPLPA